MHKFKSVLKYMHNMNFNLRASNSVTFIFCHHCKSYNLLGSIDLVGFLLISFFLVSVVKASFAAR